MKYHLYSLVVCLIALGVLLVSSGQTIFQIGLQYPNAFWVAFVLIFLTIWFLLWQKAYVLMGMATTVLGLMLWAYSHDNPYQTFMGWTFLTLAVAAFATKIHQIFLSKIIAKG